MPIVPVHDIAIKDGDLIAATHGRSFFVIDDINVLRQLSAETLAKRAHLFTPRASYRINWGGAQAKPAPAPVRQPAPAARPAQQRAPEPVTVAEDFDDEIPF